MYLYDCLCDRFEFRWNGDVGFSRVGISWMLVKSGRVIGIGNKLSFLFKKNIFIFNRLLRNLKCISFWSYESKYYDVLKKKKDDCVSIL